MHPLPIGRQALMTRRDVDDLSEWAEVYSVLPFDEYQTAMWALRVEGEWGPKTEHVLDLFGLAEYPTENHQRFDIAVAGVLTYVLRGQSMFFPDVLQAARRWWSQFKGLFILGRPLNSGTWSSTDEFKTELYTVVTALRTQGRKVTQEAVVEFLSRDIKTLTRCSYIQGWAANFLGYAA
jgi:hypothetical protein